MKIQSVFLTCYRVLQYFKQLLTFDIGHYRDFSTRENVIFTEPLGEVNIHLYTPVEGGWYYGNTHGGRAASTAMSAL